MEFNGDFRYDLNLGQLGEKLVLTALKGTMEVKTDYQAFRTGNLFIEYSCRGNPSGLAKTHANWWAFVISNENILLIETNKLKELCRKYLHTRRDITGGDNNSTKGILLPIIELIKANNNLSTKH